MGYLTIKEATAERLHLQREPTTRSWAILMGLVSLGMGAAYYSGDYVWWKIAYMSGSVFVGLTCMEDWEECILDKTSKKVTIRRQTLIQKLFQATEGQKIVVADLDDVVSVSVQSEEVKYGGTGYIVVINFGAGYSLGVTETTNLDGDKSEQEYIAEKIITFLGLNKLEDEETDLLTAKKSDVAMAVQQMGGAAASPAESSTPDMAEINAGPVTTEIGEPSSILADRQSSSDDSDDSFEQIDRAELVNYDETQDCPEETQDSCQNNMDLDQSEGADGPAPTEN